MNKSENEKLICDKCDGECGHREHCKYESDEYHEGMAQAEQDLNFDDFGEAEFCEKCQSDKVWEDCWKCGGEGGTDGEELMMEDPFWYSEDDFRRCDICEGKGGYYLCLSSKCRNDG